MISVKCKSHVGELHCNRYFSGIRGQSIRYKDKWLTPQEFASTCGGAGTGRKYLEIIQTDYGPLKALTASGTLKPGPAKKQPEEKGQKEDDKGGEAEEDVEEEEEEDDDDDDEDDDEDDDDEEEEEVDDDEDGKDEEEDDDDDDDDDEDEDMDDEIDDDEDNEGGAAGEREPEQQDPSTGNSEGRKKKKKKKKHHHRDDWKRQIATQLKTELDHNDMLDGSNGQVQQEPMMAAAAHDIFIQQHDLSLQPHQTDGGMEAGSLLAAPTFAAPQPVTLDVPPKMSPSPLIQIPQQALDAGGTVYLMSPHPSMSTPATPQHNPFASSPAPSLTQHTPIKPATSVAAGESGVRRGPTGTLAKFGNMLKVRCKSTTAVLNASKYESGSKGKCIQLSDEWLTPNEFEERAGSKAKKYLSSIKCMGRPLRVYVNSGELRGTGPPMPPKVKTPKLKPLQGGGGGAAGGGTTNGGGSIMTTAVQHIAPAPTPTPIQAPPTPSHISSAPAIPQNLIMATGAQQPILINQATTMASSMMGIQQVPTMTFTLAQPVEVRQAGQI